MPHIPIRTCIVCGAKHPKSKLLRLGLVAEGTVARTDSGRGAYVCVEGDCINRVHPKKLAFTLRLRSIPVDLRLDEPAASTAPPKN